MTLLSAAVVVGPGPLFLLQAEAATKVEWWLVMVVVVEELSEPHRSPALQGVDAALSTLFPFALPAPSAPRTTVGLRVRVLW